MQDGPLLRGEAADAAPRAAGGRTALVTQGSSVGTGPFLRGVRASPVGGRGAREAQRGGRRCLCFLWFNRPVRGLRPVFRNLRGQQTCTAPTMASAGRLADSGAWTVPAVAAGCHASQTRRWTVSLRWAPGAGAVRPAASRRPASGQDPREWRWTRRARSSGCLRVATPALRPAPSVETPGRGPRRARRCLQRLLPAQRERHPARAGAGSEGVTACTPHTARPSGEHPALRPPGSP